MDEAYREWQPPAGFRPSRRRDVDFESLDGRLVVDTKLGAQGVRDLHGALMHLAILLEEEPAVERAFLVIRFPRLTFERAQEAWKRARGLLRPDIAARLAVVLLTSNRPDPWFDPDDQAVRQVAHTLAFDVGGVADQGLPKRSVDPTSPKFFEFWKVLLNGWLRGSSTLPPAAGRRHRRLFTPDGDSVTRVAREPRRAEVACARYHPRRASAASHR